MRWLFPSNPLTVREARERWRRPLAIVWLGVYAASLALVGVWLYHDSVPPTVYGGPGTLGVGKTLFRQFASLQLLIWLGLGVFLGAPSLAVERQRRSLLDFFLAGVSPAQIVAAKWRSLAAFALVAMLCPLPVMALCFVLGGVTPAEFGAFALLLVAVGLVSCAVGLLISVECRDVSSALSAATLCAAILVPVGGVVAVVLPIFPPMVAPAAFFLGIMAAFSALEWTRDKLSAICLNLGEEAQAPRRFEARVVFEGEASSSVFQASPEDYEANEFALPTILGPNGEFLMPPETVQTQVEVAGRHDIELSLWENQLSGLARENPVTWRMWRAYLGTTSRFSGEKREAHPSKAALMVGIALFGLGVFTPLEMVWRVAMLAATFVVSGLILAQLAPSFAREREDATLEPLALTALSPFEIVVGKIGGALLIAARLGIWPFFTLGLAGLSVGPLYVLAFLILCAAQLLFSATLAAWASLVCRQASVAAGLCWGITGVLWGFGVVFSFSTPGFWDWWFQSVRALVSVQGPSIESALRLALGLLILAALGFGGAIWRLKRTFGAR